MKLRELLSKDRNTKHKRSVDQGVAEGSDDLNYIGNCTDDDVIEHIFGDATGFAQAVEEYGDEFVLDDLVVKYDPETDVHSFYYKKQGVAEGSTQTFAGKDPMTIKSPKGGTPTMMIVTAQGSRYLITSDGMVLRNKSFHANTGGDDQGLKDWSDAIEFYDPGELPGGATFPMSVAKAVEKRLPVALGTTQDGKRALLIYNGAQWRVAKISDVYKHVAAADDPIVATYSTTPKLNWNVLDYTLGANKALKSVHPGSPVTHGIRLGQKQGVAEDLDEAVGGNYLYHATGSDINDLKNIISNGLITNTANQERTGSKLSALSFTRNWRYALTTKDDDGQGTTGIANGVIFVVDQSILRQKNKMQSVDRLADVQNPLKSILNALLKVNQVKDLYGLADNMGDLAPADLAALSKIAGENVFGSRRFIISVTKAYFADKTNQQALADAQSKIKQAISYFVKTSAGKSIASAGGSTGSEYEEVILTPLKYVPFKDLGVVGYMINPAVDSAKQQEIRNLFSKVGIKEMPIPNSSRPVKGQQGVAEDWSTKYKRSIDCNNPKGFSQRAHCQGRKKNEDLNDPRNQIWYGGNNDPDGPRTHQDYRVTDKIDFEGLPAGLIYRIRKDAMLIPSGLKGKEATEKFYKKYEKYLKPHHAADTKKESAGDRGDIPTGPGEQLIPFPAGTTMIDVSDAYDWYKLGMVISDLDDADPKIFGQGAPHTAIVFGSEEEEHKLLPLLKRLGLRVHDIDRPEDVKKAIPAKALIQRMEENFAEDSEECPPATQNIELNLKNRQKAIDEYGYGPLNPDLPNTKFWLKKVDEWNLDSANEAKQSLCGNCAAFDVRQETLDCIAKGIDGENSQDAEGVIEAGDLGYCKFLKFKCASRRTCDAWVTGGPLTDSTQVNESLVNESKSAPLYHFTSWNSLVKILSTNQLVSPHGKIYLTRDYKRQFLPREGELFKQSYGLRIDQNLLTRDYGRKLQASGQDIGWDEKKRQAWLSDPKNADEIEKIKRTGRGSGLIIRGANPVDIVKGTIGQSRRWESEEHLNIQSLPNLNKYITGIVISDSPLGADSHFVQSINPDPVTKTADVLINLFSGPKGFDQRKWLLDTAIKLGVPLVYERKEFDPTEIKNRIIQLYSQRKKEREEEKNKPRQDFLIITNPGGGGTLVSGSDINSAIKKLADEPKWRNKEIYGYQVGIGPGGEKKKFDQPIKIIDFVKNAETQKIGESANKKEAVRRIQKMLNKKFNANLDIDGVLGPLTLRSINKFIPNARIGPANEPDKTTAVQGKKIKKKDIEENFADGRNPQDKGDSARHGIRKGMSIAQLKKIRSSDSASARKKQLAHWQINMRQGKKK